MARIIFFFIVNIVFTVSNAQQNFMDCLTENSEGQGTVKVFQSDELTRKVNGAMQSVATRDSVNDAGQDSLDINKNIQNDRYVPQAKKTIGFRIQIYSGGNSRESRNEARRMAARAKGWFRDLSVYTLFQTPRWICRVGDYRTIEEANQMLRKMKETNDFEEASIVKSVIKVSY